MTKKVPELPTPAERRHIFRQLNRAIALGEPGEGGTLITERPGSMESPCKRKRQGKKKTRKKIRK